ncbi:hypothetical protein AA313_de0201226 [Arthrobotrys entomopaga]|nr:hypothetical protein AA313_de0201226 [Arthrobotrys entomopaga]
MTVGEVESNVVCGRMRTLRGSLSELVRSRPTLSELVLLVVLSILRVAPVSVLSMPCGFLSTGVMYTRFSISGEIHAGGRIPLLYRTPLIRLLMYMNEHNGLTQSPASTVGSPTSRGLCHHRIYTISAHRTCPIVFTSSSEIGSC